MFVYRVDVVSLVGKLFSVMLERVSKFAVIVLTFKLPFTSSV